MINIPDIKSIMTKNFSGSLSVTEVMTKISWKITLAWKGLDEKHAITVVGESWYKKAATTEAGVRLLNSIPVSLFMKDIRVQADFDFRLSRSRLFKNLRSQHLLLRVFLQPAPRRRKIHLLPKIMARSLI
jgi:hypothetical protein